jgi:hypothetical protein
MADLMTERQKALLAYVMTIGPEIRGWKSLEDLTNRILRCAREDSSFVAQGFATGLIEFGRRALEQKTNDVVGMFAAKAGEFFGDLARKKK